MLPTFWESLALGAGHGLAEILPISASGHGALADMLFGVSPRALALDVLLRVGTLLAIVVMLWPRLKAAVQAGLAALLEPRLFSTAPGARDALVLLLAAVPGSSLSFLLRHVVERLGHSPLAIGVGLLGTAAVLFGSRWTKLGLAERPGVVGALLMGVAQGVAVLPGLSATAATITLALWLGVRRERAFELALLVSLPTSLVTLVLELLAAERTRAALAPGLVWPAVVGCGAAFLAGLVALWLLRRSVAAGHLSWFVAWLVPVSLATLALAKAWPHA